MRRRRWQNVETHTRTLSASRAGGNAPRPPCTCWGTPWRSRTKTRPVSKNGKGQMGDLFSGTHSIIRSWSESQMTLLLNMLPCNIGGLEIAVSFLVSKVLYLLHLPLQLKNKTWSLLLGLMDNFKEGKRENLQHIFSIKEYETLNSIGQLNCSSIWWISKKLCTLLYFSSPMMATRASVISLFNHHCIKF